MSNDPNQTQKNSNLLLCLYFPFDILVMESVAFIARVGAIHRPIHVFHKIAFTTLTSEITRNFAIIVNSIR